MMSARKGRPLGGPTEPRPRVLSDGRDLQLMARHIDEATAVVSPVPQEISPGACCAPRLEEFDDVVPCVARARAREILSCRL